MPKQTVSLVLRVNHPKGKRTHHTAVLAANGRLKPHYGIVGGRQTHLPESSYYLRYRVGGRRVWESVGADPNHALSQRAKRLHELAGVALGIELPSRPARQERSSAAAAIDPKMQYEVLIRSYASDVEALHNERTANQYHRDLAEFGKVSGAKLPAAITRLDVQTYIRHLLKRKMKPKTIENRLTTLRAFLRKHGESGDVINKLDAPKVHRKIPHVYAQREITALLRASSHEAKLVWSVLLAAGLREQELSYLGWEDIVFDRGLLHLHAKPDLGFSLKDREERQIPLPTDLVERLRTRRSLRPNDRLVFPTDSGKAEGHFLRQLKQVAFEAGLNCGLCINRAGKSCRMLPVCGRWQLHSFRRTAATRWHEAGLSVPSVQRLLGHSDVETTMRYLTGQDLGGAAFRDSIDRSFASMTA